MTRVVLMFATGQTAANILPLSEAALRPEVVCIAVTQEMREKGKHEDLRNQVLQQGIKVEEYLDIDNELDIAGLEQTFSQWMLDNHADDDVLVNLCGGLKTMTVAAYKVFSSLGARQFYGHHDGRVIWLDQPFDDTLKLNPKIRLDRYLKSYHYEILSRNALTDIPASHKVYVSELEEYQHRYFESFQNGITVLNALSRPVISACNDYERKIGRNAASTARYPNLSTRFERKNQQVSDLIAFIKNSDDLITLKADSLEFKDIPSAKLSGGGGWLELLVAEKLRKISAVRDISVNVQFDKSLHREGRATQNEMDVMALCGTRLLIVECKTVNWSSGEESSPLEAIYKLGALSDIGGLNTKPLFVSLYDLPAHAQTRAAEKGIEVIAGKRLLELESRLKQWAGET